MNPSSAQFWRLLLVRIGMLLRAGAARSQLGYLWWLLEPALEAAVFYVVFGIFFASGRPDFVAFLLVGLVPYTWFARSINNSHGSILGSKWALTNFPLHPVFFPLAEVGQDLIKQILPFAVLLLFLIFYGVSPTAYWLFLPIIVLAQFALIVSASCFLASLIPLVEDLKHLIPTVLTMAMFASGIFYDPEILLTAEWRSVYFMNPLASLLAMYRDCLLHGKLPSSDGFFVITVWVAMLSATTALLVSKLRFRYSRLIQE